MPIRINGTETISPSKDWKTITLKDGSEVKFDDNYYVKYQENVILNIEKFRRAELILNFYDFSTILKVVPFPTSDSAILISPLWYS